MKKIYIQVKRLKMVLKFPKCNWIAFLDSKTIASENWLSEYKKLILKNNYDVIFGSTKFVSNKKIKYQLYS